ncbi:ribonuclease H-like domain-containing protein [Tahibacter soli]|uniref:Ribonuclease H-like domain-containing protein n=1 Tax=Tahibacter soli TaxID=2983605 RepID=A0A9X3YP96_9GAMM|nr:ribonuclease H-like domain-containing protein [Tahibacter soli]MDC8014950.1 ribonuclease H-like domain-containing protein [Tahibacter soli]
MNALVDKLKKLRAQAGAAAAPANAAHDDTERLRRLLQRRPEPRAASLPAERVALAGEEIAPGLRYVEAWRPYEAGAPVLPPRWHDAHAVARERFVCFDTETTGLAGGSGTRAFMIGAADWHDGGLRVRQLYLTRMAGEAAMLDAFASWLAEASVLVSYNGRSYDAPLLATRYRLARRANPLAGLPHVDLLHPVRRAYRGRWENCRLATIERQLLGIVREDDLPGAQAPAAWLAYLRHGAAGRLMQVIEHNRQDVVTLARLLDAMAVDASPESFVATMSRDNVTACA